MVAASSEKMAKLSADRLREMLHYDLSTGLFTWRIRPRLSVRIGDVAGTTSPRGYVAIGISRRVYFAHRLAWLYVHGKWPAENIDHINGVRTDNRWSNLREASHSENCGNRRLSKANSSGFKGVSFESSSGKWVAQLYHNGKNKKIGRFDDPRRAHEAYLSAAKTVFGDFARSS